MQTFTDLFKIILEGNRESSRNAARDVRKLLYRATNGREKYNGMKKIINNAPEIYRKITEDWRQENFVMAVSVMYFLHDRESEQDFLFPWLFYLIQDNNGNIRHSVVRMFRNELGPLTVHLRHPENGFSSSKIINEKRDRILFDMYNELVFLAHKFHKPIYNKYKYIASIPTGQYKSIQLILAELEDDCGEKCINKFKKKINI